MKRSPVSWLLGWISLGWQRFRDLLNAARQDRLVWTWLIVFLSIDLLFSLWFAGTRFCYGTELGEALYEIRFLRIDADGGLPEWYSYAKTLLLVVLIGRMAFSTRQLIYFSLVLLFGIVLLDDALEIHETVGKQLVGTLDLRPMLGVRARDVGEVITWAVMGAFALPFIVAGFLFSKRTHVANGLALLLPFAGLVFFAVFVDQVYHAWRDAFPGADTVLATLEDGGEMIVISIECALAAVLVRGAASSVLEDGPTDHAFGQ